jgi:hypothetical protein
LASLFGNLRAVKVFLEFEEMFYPAVLETEQDYKMYDDNCRSEDFGERGFYDETYGQDTTSHIMGMLAYGRAADQYIGKPHADILDSVLQELDIMFDGKATETFTGVSVVQDWSVERK